MVVERRELVAPPPVGGDARGFHAARHHRRRRWRLRDLGGGGSWEPLNFYFHINDNYLSVLIMLSHRRLPTPFKGGHSPRAGITSWVPCCSVLANISSSSALLTL